MGIFDRFRRSPDQPGIKSGWRGEDLTYELSGRVLDLSFTWVTGPRLYLEGSSRWRGGAPPTDEEWARIFPPVVRFLVRRWKTLTVVINQDDPRVALWEHLLETHRADVTGVERTTTAANRRAEREMFLGVLNRGAGMWINGEPIDGERRLDEALARIRNGRP